MNKSLSSIVIVGLLFAGLARGQSPYYTGPANTTVTNLAAMLTNQLRSAAGFFTNGVTVGGTLNFAQGVIDNYLYLGGVNVLMTSPSAGVLALTDSSGANFLKLQMNGATIYTGAASFTNFVNVGSLYSTGDVSALTFTDRSKSPDSLTNAYAIVASVETANGHVNHAKLHPGAWGTKEIKTPTGRQITNVVDGIGGKITNVVAEATTSLIPDQTKRDIGMIISAQGLVIQDLIKRLEALEKK